MIVKPLIVLSGPGTRLVFIIGDSFTEGVTSSTFDKTMCELLKHRLITDRYLVCPFGVGGTDLVQYRLVAEKFIPELKPDAVYIAFCSNDFADFNRIPTPHIAMYYQSNVGYLSTAIYNHVIPTKDSMYHFFRNTSPVISGPWIAQHSFIAAGIVAALFPRKYQWFPNDGYDTTVTARELARIHNVCAENKTPLVVCHIPDKNYFYSSAQEYAGIYGKGFGSMLPYVKFYDQGDMSSADYRKEDSHFSDSGNKKFADFLERQIRDTKIVSRIR
jgi:lysophospholipase L1-like esterase